MYLPNGPHMPCDPCKIYVKNQLYRLVQETLCGLLVISHMSQVVYRFSINIDAVVYVHTTRLGLTSPQSDGRQKYKLRNVSHPIDTGGKEVNSTFL
jgi:hypothetical protein